MKLTWPAAAALLLLPGFVLSQSLGEVAERERAKRKNSGAKAYTNDDLDQGKPSPSPSASPSPSPSATPEATKAASPPGVKSRFKVPGATPPPPPPTGVKPAPEEPPPPRQAPEEGKGSKDAKDGKDTKEASPQPQMTQEYWHGQLEARQKAVAEAEKLVADTQKKLGEIRQGQVQPLPIDAMTQQPPVPSVQGEDYAKVQQELADANARLQAARQSLADLEEEARRAGVPPGWVR